MKEKPLKIIAGTPDRPLIIGNIEIPCYVLEDETRVLVQSGFLKAFGRRGNPRITPGQKDDYCQMPELMQSKRIKPFISKDLLITAKPVLFQGFGGVNYGYPARLLPRICDVYLEARSAGVLLISQMDIAKRAEILMRGLAEVGIIALVDEATGYQEIRAQRALATILEKFIAKELQPWTKTFPYEFYEQIFRLKGWDGPEGMKGPRVIGRYTNDFVYDRLAPGVLDELKRINPALPGGQRKDKHHQWFTPDLGHPKLKEHLAAVTALMRASANWDSFMRNLNRAFTKRNETRPLPYDD